MFFSKNLEFRNKIEQTNNYNIDNQIVMIQTP